MNHIVLIGRLVADPETRYTQSGIAMTKFCLAVDRKFKNQAGERETDFINCVAWRKAAEIIGQYMTKGQKFAVQGSLQSRKWEDKDGNKRVSFDVQVDEFNFIDSKGSGGGSRGPARQVDSGPGDNDAPPPDAPPDNMMEDDLPF
jgi:single-strand DNA-binding protein